ncbi:MAG: hypothetical protein V2I82_13065 [Halieaceae bacterium]|jgi:hypothetical protein|nr:hypothetical protein [Halieaceae bacterium]
MTRIKLLITLALASTLFLGSGARAQGGAPTCDDLVWSAMVLAANPDIREACQGVYQRGDELYARVEIELTRVRGNRLSFRPQHTDGSEGKPRSITVPGTWRARIDGREYRARDLLPGQRLSVYIPEDRFALALADELRAGEARDAEIELIAIEEAEVVSAMPKTASALPAILAAGAALTLLGLALAMQRRSARPLPARKSQRH